MAATREIKSHEVREAADTGFANKVHFIVENIGTSLAAFTFDTTASTVSRWANGKASPGSLLAERRIENLYRVLQFMLDDHTGTQSRSRHEVRAWLMGMNAHLDDAAPAEAIRDGDFKTVMAAARAYSHGG